MCVIHIQHSVRDLEQCADTAKFIWYMRLTGRVCCSGGCPVRAEEAD